MSLFHDPREVRLINDRKRRKDMADTVQETEVTHLYACNWCTDEYDSETELDVHRKFNHVPEVAKLMQLETTCKICILEHSDLEELAKHIKSAHLLSSEDAEHVQREIFVCNTCSLIFFHKQMLALHIQYMHESRGKNQRVTETCPKCNKKIKYTWFHFNRHGIQSVACCPICLKKCRDSSDLQEHLQCHAHYYYCTICLYETRFKDSFTAHMQAHNSNLHLSGNIAIDESLLYRCFIPRKQSKRTQANVATRGLTLYHLSLCVLCRGLCVEDEKAAHIAKYHLVDIVATKKLYMCVCGEQFFNKVLLKHHVFKLKGEHRPLDS